MIVKSKTNNKALLLEGQYGAKVCSAKAEPTESNAKKIAVAWKIPGHDPEIEKEYPPSFETGTPLRRDVETILGRQLTQAEAETGFNLNSLIGRDSNVAVMHKSGSGGGYKALNDKPIVPSFLKRLDWFREKQIRRMDQADIPYGSGAPSQHPGKGNRPEPKGYPFSYLAQFHNTGGQYLINHPFRPWFQRFISHPGYLAKKCFQRLFRRWDRAIARWFGKRQT
jgi:hypothetical protein